MPGARMSPLDQPQAAPDDRSADSREGLNRPHQEAADLSAAERDRVLAKQALFNPPPPVLPDGRRELVGLSREELAAEMAAMGEKPFRAKQLWHWIYHQGETDFARMTSIAGPMRAKLGERFVVSRPEPATVQTSRDETRKFL